MIHIEHFIEPIVAGGGRWWRVVETTWIIYLYKKKINKSRKLVIIFLFSSEYKI